MTKINCLKEHGCGKLGILETIFLANTKTISCITGLSYFKFFNVNNSKWKENVQLSSFVILIKTY